MNVNQSRVNKNTINHTISTVDCNKSPKYGCGFDFFKIDTCFSFHGNFWKNGEEGQIAGIWNRDNKWCWLNASLQFMRILYLNQSLDKAFDNEFQKHIKELIQCNSWYNNDQVIELVFQKKLLHNFIQSRGYNANVFIRDITCNRSCVSFNAIATSHCPKCNSKVQIRYTSNCLELIEYNTKFEKSIETSIFNLMQCSKCHIVFPPGNHKQVNFSDFLMISNDDTDYNIHEKIHIFNNSFELIAALGFFTDQRKNGHWGCYDVKNKLFIEDRNFWIYDSLKNTTLLLYKKENNRFNCAISMHENHLCFKYNQFLFDMDINNKYCKKTKDIKILHSIHLFLVNFPYQNAILNIHDYTGKISRIYKKRDTINTKIATQIKQLLLKQKNQILFPNIKNKTSIETEVENKSMQFNNTCWKFNPLYIEKICEFLHLNKPTIDCFASSMNTQCDRYISLLDDLSCIATNFFKQQNRNWNNEIVWANPPFDPKIITDTIVFFINQHLRGFLLMPRWTNQIWWQYARKNSQIEIIFPKHQELFLPAFNNYSCYVGAPRWDVSVFFFNYSGKFSNYKQLYYNYVRQKILFNPFISKIHRLDLNYQKIRDNARERIVEDWKILVTFRNFVKITTKHKNLLKILLSKLQSFTQISNNCTYWKLSRTSKSIVYFVKDKRRKNIVREFLRNKIKQYKEIYLNTGAVHLIIKVMPNKIIPSTDQQIHIFITKHSILQLFISFYSNTYRDKELPHIEINNQQNLYRLTIMHQNPSQFYNKIKIWKKHNSIVNSDCWAKRYSTQWCCAKNRHNFNVGSVCKTIISKNLGYNKFVFNNIFKEYRQLSHHEINKLTHHYPFLITITNNSNIKYIYKQNELSIYYWNINGLSYSKLNSKAFNLILGQKPDIIALAELKYNVNICIPNYDLIEIRTPSRKHGIAMLCRTEIRSSISRTWKLDNCDLICCLISKFLIIACYCPPTSQLNIGIISNFWLNLDEILKNNSWRQIIIIGDFNARLGSLTGDHLLGRNINTTRLREIINNYQLKIINNKKHYGKYTFQRNKGHSIIDLVLTNKSDLVNMNIRQEHIYLNDHFPISCTFRANVENQNQIYTLRSKISKVSLIQVYKRLKYIKEKGEINIDNIGIYYYFLFWKALICQGSISLNMPKQTWNPCSLEIARKLLIAEERQSNGLDCNKILNEIKELQIAETAKHLQWILNNLYKLPYNKRIKQIARILSTDNQNTDSACINEIAKYFSGISNDHLNNLPYVANEQWIDQVEKATWQNSQHENYIPWQNIQITEDEIIDAIKHSRTCSASGTDQISYRLFKNNISEIVPIFKLIFDLAWKSKRLPNCCKKGWVRVIPKKGNSYRLDNLRPITILPCITRIFSYIVNKRLTRWLTANQIIHESQGGSQTGRGIHEQVMIINLFCDFMSNKNKNCFFIFYDVQKAFDTMWREGMLYKIYQMGVRGHIFDIIRNLYFRTSSCIKIKNDYSKFYQTSRGTLQGDPISSTLYTCFLNDLSINLDKENKRNSVQPNSEILFPNVRLYIDDTAIISNDFHELKRLSAIVEQHSKKWCYILSPSKSVFFSWNSFKGWAASRNCINIEKYIQKYKQTNHLIQNHWLIDAVLDTKPYVNKNKTKIKKYKNWFLVK